MSTPLTGTVNLMGLLLQVEGIGKYVNPLTGTVNMMDILIQVKGI